MCDGPNQRESDFLWNTDVLDTLTSRAPDLIDAQVLELYKLAVDMADKTSTRRLTTNSFYMTINTAAVAAIGVFWQHPPEGSRWLLCFPYAILVTLCILWFATLASSRKLSRIKYGIIVELETRLAAAPLGRAEWSRLVSDEERPYIKLTFFEQGVPLLFIAAYTVALAMAVAAG